MAGAALLMGVAFAGASSAQEFKGAELSAELLAYSGGDESLSNNYRGSVEFGAFGAFGVQADLAFTNFEDTDAFRNVTVHATYDALSLGTVGAFYSRDSIGESTATLWGVEAGASFGSAGGEGYLGFGDLDDEGVLAFGFDGRLDVTPSISVLASGAGLNADGSGFGRLALGGEYRFGGDGPAVYAAIGRLSSELDDGSKDSASFLGIGARLSIGPQGGTTFGQRGYSEILGSF
jgi:hypothetical protein